MAENYKMDESLDNCKIGVTSGMIAVGAAVLEDEMLEGSFLESGIRRGVAEAYRAMYGEAKKQKTR